MFSISDEDDDEEKDEDEDEEELPAMALDLEAENSQPVFRRQWSGVLPKLNEGFYIFFFLSILIFIKLQ